MSLNMISFSRRKPASAGKFRDGYRAQRQNVGDTDLWNRRNAARSIL